MFFDRENDLRWDSSMNNKTWLNWKKGGKETFWEEEDIKIGGKSRD